MINDETKLGGLLLSDDLIFTSRITGEARTIGMTIRAARSVEILKNLAKAEMPSLLMIDLSNPGLVVEELLSWIKSMSADKPIRVVAYGSHVDVGTLKAARAAGCDEVMPRSQFIERLPRQLNVWVAGRGT
jgi:CheY-like chemotaxis protein